MNRYARAHLSDDALHRSAISLARAERGATADLLADLAEIDVRKSYLAMAYPSLFAYCVAELRLSEDAAYNRIKAARTAWRFPVIFEAVADGRLNLTSVLLLKPYLTETTAQDLLPAAMDKSKSDIEKLLAERYPRMDVPSFVAQIAAAPVAGLIHHAALALAEGAPGEPELPASAPVPTLPGPGTGAQLVPEPVVSTKRSIVKPIAPQRYEIHFTMGESCHEKLRYLRTCSVSTCPRVILDGSSRTRWMRAFARSRSVSSLPPTGRIRTPANPVLIPATSPPTSAAQSGSATAPSARS
jgi:hypothetical protein